MNNREAKEERGTEGKANCQTEKEAETRRLGQTRSRRRVKGEKYVRERAWRRRECERAGKMTTKELK